MKHVIETLALVNAALKNNPNALTQTRGGDIDPDAAYIEIVRELLAATKK